MEIPHSSSPRYPPRRRPPRRSPPWPSPISLAPSNSLHRRHIPTSPLRLPPAAVAISLLRVGDTTATAPPLQTLLLPLAPALSTAAVSCFLGSSCTISGFGFSREC